MSENKGKPYPQQIRDLIVTMAKAGHDARQIVEAVNHQFNRRLAPNHVRYFCQRMGAPVTKAKGVGAFEKPRPIPDYKPPPCTAVREDSIIRPIPLSRLMGGR